MRKITFVSAIAIIFAVCTAVLAAQPTPTPKPAPKPTPKRMEDMTKEEIENLSDEEAINAESEMQKRKYDEAEKLRVQANSLIAQGKDRDAIPLLNKARALNSNDTRILAAGAVALLHMGDLVNAEAAAKAGVNSFFKSADIYDALGQVQVAKNELPAAMESFGKALDIDDKFAPAYLHRGVAKALSSDKAGALADLAKANQLDPKLYDVYFTRGEFYINVANEPAKGVADFDKYIAAVPNSTMAYTKRATGYYNLDQYDKAIADLTKAIQLESKNYIAYTNRGIIYEVQRKKELARADFQAALAIKPDYQLAKDHLAALGTANNAAPANSPSTATSSASTPSTKELDKLMDGLDPKPVSTDFSSVMKPTPTATPTAETDRKKLDAALDKAIADNKLDASINYSALKELSLKGQASTDASANSTAPNAGKKYADAMAAYNDGMALAAKDDLDGALAAFKAAAAMDPKFVIAQNNVGAMYAKKNDLENSMYAYMKALSIDPNFEISQNNLEGMIFRVKDAIKAGTLKLSKQGFTNYYTARSKVYQKIVLNSDIAANNEYTRRSNTLKCSILLDAYKAHYRFDSFLRNLTDDYNRGNTTYSADDMKLVPEMVQINKRNMSQWFDIMHTSGCIVYAFDPEF